MKAAFKKGFEKGLGIKLEPLALSDAKLVEINQLAETKYKNLDWSYSTEK